MNKIVESINFASDAYWGDPNKFNFRAMIDSYTTTTEVTQGQDRTVKTAFEINLMGHIISDTINASIANMSKFYSKSELKFNLETAGSVDVLNAKARTAATTAPTRFYDGSTGGGSAGAAGMTSAERAYLSLNTILDTNNNSNTINSGDNSITFIGVTIATPPDNFPALTVNDFQIFINGQFVEPSAITSISQVGNDVVIDFSSGLEYGITDEMEIAAVGKFNV